MTQTEYDYLKKIRADLKTLDQAYQELNNEYEEYCDTHNLSNPICILLEEFEDKIIQEQCTHKFVAETTTRSYESNYREYTMVDSYNKCSKCNLIKNLETEDHSNDWKEKMEEEAAAYAKSPAGIALKASLNWR